MKMTSRSLGRAASPSRLRSCFGLGGIRIAFVLAAVVVCAPAGARERVRVLACPRSTNLLAVSGAFEDAAWTQPGFWVSATNMADPLGGASARRALELAENGSHQFNRAGVAFAGGNYTLSAYVKPVGRQWFRLMLFDGANFKQAWFDVANGVAGTADAGVTPHLVAAGDGWYRVAITYSATAGSGMVFVNGALADGGSDVYLGDAAKGYDLYGVQLETGGAPTRYHATTTGPARGCR